MCARSSCRRLSSHARSTLCQHFCYASSSTLLPYVTCMVNLSLSNGRLPDSQKHAVIIPRLKRPGLDTADMTNYRPVSQVTFTSKVIERAVAKQPEQYLTVNGYCRATSLSIAVIIQRRRQRCGCCLMFSMQLTRSKSHCWVCSLCWIFPRRSIAWITSCCRQWRIQNFITGAGRRSRGVVWEGGYAHSPEKNLNFYLKMVGFGAF